jgi:hypothetical protein
MKCLKKITRSNFFIKLKSWEYWPFGIIQFPAIVYWLWLSARARSLVFFSASNPGIQMGGMFGESKYEVLSKIPRQYTPKTMLISIPVNTAEVRARIKTADLCWPLIFKPDIGERGFMVMKITNERELESYLRRIKTRFLIQEFVQLPLEFGVFYMRLPDDKKGKVISLVAKEMLSVSGDGASSLKELIFRNDRAKLQWRKLKDTFHDRLDSIIPLGEKIELVSIGNHALGTRFINANHLINGQLSNTFDRISQEIPGFYFGRFDLRCPSLEDLYEGKVKIMELNGCGAEPTHIYDKDFSMWKALGVLIDHWQSIFRIALANKKQGATFVSHREAFASYRKFRSVVK